MSFIQYKKYLDKGKLKDLNLNLPRQKRLTIVLSDSKGNYVKDHVKSKVGRDIRWWNVKGLTSELSVYWLIKKLDFKIRKHSPLSRYVWLGTCNLTTKLPGAVTLNRNYMKDCEETISRYNKSSTYCSSRK